MAAPNQVSGTNAFPWRFVTPLYMGSALNPINSSLIATALVPIAAAVHVSVGRTAVLVSALYLASAIAQPTGGKLAEEFGPRRVFLAGILTVLAGGLVGGFGQDLTTLVVARVLIGVGTSAGYPSAMLLIRRRADAAGLGAPPGSVLGGLMMPARPRPRSASRSAGCWSPHQRHRPRPARDHLDHGRRQRPGTRHCAR
jgi:MFS family permease